MNRTILLVTYERLDVTEIEAEEIFGGEYRAIDAVEALAGGKRMESGIIYHFNDMGSSAMIAPSDTENFQNEREDLTQDFVAVPLEIAMRSHPDVASVCVYEDRPMNWADPASWPGSDANTEPAGMPPDRTASWSLNMIHANGLSASEFSGKGIKIAILDTGIAAHEHLKVQGGVSFYPGITDFRDDKFGHGTHCAGIAAGRIGGIAKDARLFSIKVAHTHGADPSAILSGLNWAHRNRMNVVSISLAGAADLTFLPSFANAVQALMEVNCLVIASTGDNGNVGYPANTPGVIAVGGCDHSYTILKGTGIGGKVNHLTILAPAENITTTFHRDNGYIDGFSGSSAATPHVAGLVALLQQKFPGITPLQVLSKILASAQPVRIGHNQINVFGGTTIIDCNAALSLA